MFPLEILRNISVYCTPYHLLTHKSAVSFYDDNWFKEHLEWLCHNQNITISLRGLSFVDVYKRYLRTGDIYKYDTSTPEFSILSDNQGVYIGKGIKAASFNGYGPSLILAFNGDLICDGEHSDSGVIDISYDSYVTSENCFFNNTWDTISRIDDNPFIGVETADGPVFAYSKSYIYIIDKSTFQFITLESPHNIKTLMLIDDNSGKILCENNNVYDFSMKILSSDNDSGDNCEYHGNELIAEDWNLNLSMTDVLSLHQNLLVKLDGSIIMFSDSLSHNPFELKLINRPFGNIYKQIDDTLIIDGNLYKLDINYITKTATVELLDRVKNVFSGLYHITFYIR